MSHTREQKFRRLGLTCREGEKLVVIVSEAGSLLEYEVSRSGVRGPFQISERKGVRIKPNFKELWNRRVCHKFGS